MYCYGTFLTFVRFYPTSPTLFLSTYFRVIQSRWYWYFNCNNYWFRHHWLLYLFRWTR